MTAGATNDRGAADGARWQEALDDFERRLAEFRSVLEPDGQPPEGMWPPADLIGTPLPAELTDRVRSLLDQAKNIEGELRRRQTELPAPQRGGMRHRRRPVSSTVYTAL